MATNPKPKSLADLLDSLPFVGNEKHVPNEALKNVTADELETLGYQVVRVGAVTVLSTLRVR